MERERRDEIVGGEKRREEKRREEKCSEEKRKGVFQEVEACLFFLVLIFLCVLDLIKQVSRGI